MRDYLIGRLEDDLIGPGTADERIGDRPSDRYLTGILFPPRTRLGADEDDDADPAGSVEPGSSGGEAIAGANVARPSSAGLSFAVRPAPGSYPSLKVSITGGRYLGEGEADDETAAVLAWRRCAVNALVDDLVLDPNDVRDIPLDEYGAAGLSLHIRTSEWKDVVLVTAVVTNTAAVPRRPGRQTVEESTLFQFRMEVRPADGSRFAARPVAPVGNDDDGLSARLIYRDVEEYAVGHVCSAEWDVGSEGAGVLATQWIPRALVPDVSPAGDHEFEALSGDAEADPLSAAWLADCSDAELTDGLQRLADAYGVWIRRQADRTDVPPHLVGQAETNLERCRTACLRMRRGVEMMRTRSEVRTAFRLANRAMALQRSWSDPKPLRWYPFQLAFALLALESTADPASSDREVMDLLWFPTGGGKTEAYLLLTAFVIYLRRLSEGEPNAQGGVTVFMRYTLRLLTIQQFQRASALICAAELLRRAPVGVSSDSARRLQSGPPISIGLWVGVDSTPNNAAAAATALERGGDSTPVQLTDCPHCRSRLAWTTSADGSRIEVACRTRDCILADAFGALPVWTVDSDIYRERPSLLIGTGDKYTQVVRNSDTAALFGIGVGQPPALIIQDELHLISGPLGTMAGVYEIAVDALCAHKGARPKVIGSTATIRRATEQVRAVFDRESFQFPPPAIDYANSGFAVVSTDRPGRLYLGVTTAGRSAKFTLQAVSASLLQAAAADGLSRQEADPYWTLMVYFNSLRELGGSLVLMQDDVDKSIDDYARRRSPETARGAPDVTELNSRVPSKEIAPILTRLGIPMGAPGAADVVLASNMISVGMDVPRLGLMVVNGQPKGIAEYIQATSRVGRGGTAGLVVTLYNGNKARDRSHYESFATWHQSLYREVEATSVTPYAARARDRALHAPLVAMARHLVSGMAQEPVSAGPFESDLRALIERIVQRAERADAGESAAVRRHLERWLDRWLDRGPLPYWEDGRPERSLLMSAEKAAAKAAIRQMASSATPTPNSLRSVEASAEFVLMRANEEAADR